MDNHKLKKSSINKLQSIPEAKCNVPQGDGDNHLPDHTAVTKRSPQIQVQKEIRIMAYEESLPRKNPGWNLIICLVNPGISKQICPLKFHSFSPSLLTVLSNIVTLTQHLRP